MAAQSPDKAKAPDATEENSESARAREHKTAKFSLIWVVPIIALILTSLLVWNNSFNNGPQISIMTNSADGIEKGKTLVKVRSVVVGTVTDVNLTKDYKHTVLTVQMNKNTDDLLRPDTAFWVVKPRIENTGISGLDTLLSGAYLQLKIGKEEGFSKNFTVLEDPPVRLGSEKGLMLTLISKAPKKLNVGATVQFRGFEVGKITETHFDMESQSIHYEIFIRDPYAQLISKSTRFWLNSGIDLKLDANGVSFNTESLDNIIVGGIAFENFSTQPVALSSVEENSIFHLFSGRDAARLSWLEEGTTYVVLIENTIEKIIPGSAVTFNGVKIGEVLKAPWFQDNGEVFTSNLLPVLFSLNYDSVDPEAIGSFVDNALKNNTLCAHLASGNIILGNSQIDLVIDKEGKCTTKALENLKSTVFDEDHFLTYNNQKIIPIVSEQALTMQLNAFVDKLNQFDVAGFSTEIQNSLQAFTKAMDAFTQSNTLVKDSAVINKLATAFENFNASVKGFGPGTTFYKSLNKNMKRIEQLLEDISPAVSEVGQSPGAILFGGADDPIPRASH